MLVALFVTISFIRARVCDVGAFAFCEVFPDVAWVVGVLVWEFAAFDPSVDAVGFEVDA